MISERFYGDTNIISIRGCLDFSVGQELRHTVQRAYAIGFQKVYFNLEGVTSMDQAGLAALFVAGYDLRKNGGKGTIVAPPPGVWARLESFLISPYFPFASTPLALDECLTGIGTNFSSDYTSTDDALEVCDMSVPD